MVEKKQKYILESAKIAQIISELGCSKSQVNKVLAMTRGTTAFAKLILKRAIELGAKKVTVTTIIEEEKL